MGLNFEMIPCRPVVNFRNDSSWCFRDDSSRFFEMIPPTPRNLRLCRTRFYSNLVNMIRKIEQAFALRSIHLHSCVNGRTCNNAELPPTNPEPRPLIYWNRKLFESSITPSRFLFPLISKWRLKLARHGMTTQTASPTAKRSSLKSKLLPSTMVNSSNIQGMSLVEPSRISSSLRGLPATRGSSPLRYSAHDRDLPQLWSESSNGGRVFDRIGCLGGVWRLSRGGVT